jgi:hypothetical protein
MPRYLKISTDLEQLMYLIEILITPLSNLPSIVKEEHHGLSHCDLDSAASSGKEWVDVRIVVS